jgi:beta-phosphoglucomutase-like phosphatase (HAD superfamily)
MALKGRRRQDVCRAPQGAGTKQMSDTEKEAFRQIGINLINEYRQQRGLKPIDWLAIDNPEASAFIRSIQLHEKTKQELHDLRQRVSDIASVYNKMAFTVSETEQWQLNYRVIIGFEKIADASVFHDRLLSLLDFLNPKPKPDPLVDVAKMMGYFNTTAKHWAGDVRTALDALGFEIREKNDG